MLEPVLLVLQRQCLSSRFAELHMLHRHLGMLGQGTCGQLAASRWCQQTPAAPVTTQTLSWTT